MMTSGTGVDLAVLVSYSGDGGVERMMNNLIALFIERGYSVDVLVLKARGGHFSGIPAAARVIRLGSEHALFAVPTLARYLRSERPVAVLSAKDRAGRATLRARRRAGVATRIVLRIGNTLSQSLVDRGPLRRWLRYRPIRRLYPEADAIVAVSDGVAADVIDTSGVDAERVRVIRNPVITPALDEQAAETAPHPWLTDDGPPVPVVLGVGRLTRQKDFPTLLRAFARLQARRDIRLIVLGEGEDRHDLERQARDLGIIRDVAFPGFVANPYCWMARASVFVLSSAWEGSPNSLTEAMHLGIPVVSTDCRSGPRELLANGRFGPLVDVGDADGLASAIEATLEAPLSRAELRGAVSEYTAERSADRYLEALGLNPWRSV